MTRTLSFEVRGSAKSKGSLTSYGPGQMVEAVAGSKEWREEVAWTASRASRKTRWARVDRPAPCSVFAVFSFERRGRAEFPTTRSTYDSDKLARNLLDALQDAEVIQDDSQVIDLHILKTWTGEGERPGVVVTVSTPS